MSDFLRIPESGCARAHALLPQFLDGELAAEESVWLGGHLEACAECRTALERFAEIDRQLTGWGQLLSSQNPAPSGTLSPRHWAIRWIPATAAVIAAAVAITVISPRVNYPTVDHQQTVFVEIPYMPPLDPHENAAIVRMDVHVATLIAAGYRVTADPDAMIPADVLVGEDGRAHAVRMRSDIDLKGKGD